MKKTPVIIGLQNPKSPANVGAVLRAAGCFGADAILYTGQRYIRASKFYTDTKNRHETIALKGVNCLIEGRPKKSYLICVELVKDATALHEFEHPENAFYVFGPEDGTIDQKLIDAADAVVYIPTIGCLNLAATVNVVLYDRLIKSKTLVTGNELIAQSKDINNHIKIKKRT